MASVLLLAAPEVLPHRLVGGVARRLQVSRRECPGSLGRGGRSGSPMLPRTWDGVPTPRMALVLTQGAGPGASAEPGLPRLHCCPSALCPEASPGQPRGPGDVGQGGPSQGFILPSTLRGFPTPWMAAASTRLLCLPSSRPSAPGVAGPRPLCHPGHSAWPLEVVPCQTDAPWLCDPFLPGPRRQGVQGPCSTLNGTCAHLPCTCPAGSGGCSHRACGAQQPGCDPDTGAPSSVRSTRGAQDRRAPAGRVQSGTGLLCRVGRRPYRKNQTTRCSRPFAQTQGWTVTWGPCPQSRIAQGAVDSAIIPDTRPPQVPRALLCNFISVLS